MRRSEVRVFSPAPTDSRAAMRKHRGPFPFPTSRFCDVAHIAAFIAAPHPPPHRLRSACDDTHRSTCAPRTPTPHPPCALPCAFRTETAQPNAIAERIAHRRRHKPRAISTKPRTGSPARRRSRATGSASASRRSRPTPAPAARYRPIHRPKFAVPRPPKPSSRFALDRHRCRG